MTLLPLTEAQHLEWASTRYAFACKIIGLDSGAVIIADPLYTNPQVVETMEELIAYMKKHREEHKRRMQQNAEREAEKRKPEATLNTDLDIDLELDL